MAAPEFEVNPDAILQLKQVTIRRGSKLLLDKVDWTVEDDERWVILGPNGAGKTTLLQLAATTMHPTSGTVGVLGEQLGAGRRVRTPAPDRPGVGRLGAAHSRRRERAGRGGLGRLRRDRPLAGGLWSPRCPAGPDAAGPIRSGRPDRAQLRHAQRGRAQAGADRPGADDRPRTAAAGRARRRNGSGGREDLLRRLAKLAADPELRRWSW